MNERRRRPGRRGRRLAALAGALLCGGAEAELRPSPYDVLATRALQAPFLDPHPVCLPDRAPAVWQPLLSLSAAHGLGAASRVLEARLHREYGEFSVADDPALDDVERQDAPTLKTLEKNESWVISYPVPDLPPPGAEAGASAASGGGTSGSGAGDEDIKDADFEVK